jgi:hypothetical protein
VHRQVTHKIFVTVVTSAKEFLAGLVSDGVIIMVSLARYKDALTHDSCSVVNVLCV